MDPVYHRVREKTAEFCSYTFRRTPHDLCSIILHGNRREWQQVKAVSISTFYTGRRMPVIRQIEQNLYIDPQQTVPAGYCEVCGGAIYAPGGVCIRCQAREE
jgi:hypothetical protein